eukprot:m.63133 g.63133  ORF g.63133 m.63133 type:complete len:57 (-) comp49614_c0_seq7:2210-2380(-)
MNERARTSPNVFESIPYMLNYNVQKSNDLGLMKLGLGYFSLHPQSPPHLPLPSAAT